MQRVKHIRGRRYPFENPMVTITITKQLQKESKWWSIFLRNLGATYICQQIILDGVPSGGAYPLENPEVTYIYHQTTLERVQVVEHISSKIRRRPIPITKQYSKGSLVVEPIPYKIQMRQISISKQPSNQAFEPSLRTKPPNQEDNPASVDALLPKPILRHVYTRLTTTWKPLLK